MKNGLLKKLDVIKVSGCDGDPNKGVMNIVSLTRPGSLQSDEPVLLGNPMPFASSSRVSQRKIRDRHHITSLFDR